MKDMQSGLHQALSPRLCDIFHFPNRLPTKTSAFISFTQVNKSSVFAPRLVSVSLSVLCNLPDKRQRQSLSQSLSENYWQLFVFDSYMTQLCRLNQTCV